jgi:hypothetical protein
MGNLIFAATNVFKLRNIALGLPSRDFVVELNLRWRQRGVRLFRLIVEFCFEFQLLDER